MRKIKLLLASFVFVLLGVFLTRSASATVLNVSIQTLPSYINFNDFNLSCSTNGTSAQFYYSRNGGAFTAFGPSIDLTTNQCVVHVDSSIITDETTYAFYVDVEGQHSSTVSTIYDHSVPGVPRDYYKEELSDGFRIHWRNPTDSDFSVVKIYRGDTPDFSADGSHEVTTQAGGADSQMTFEDHFSKQVGKTYYYDLRAIDKAGNSSDLIGDGSSVVTTVTTTPAPGTSGSSNVTQLPGGSGGGSGSVLGTETTESPSPEGTAASTSMEGSSSTSQSPLQWVLTHKKISLAVVAGLILLGYAVNYFSKKNR